MDWDNSDVRVMPEDLKAYLDMLDRCIGELEAVLSGFGVINKPGLRKYRNGLYLVKSNVDESLNGGKR
jgi:hypothetical protein